MTLGEWLAAVPSTWPAVAGLALVIGYFLWRDHRADRIANEVRDQVKNGHKTPLRFDLDEFRKEVRDGFHRVERDIGGLRSEMRTERAERIAGDQQRGRS